MFVRGGVPVRFRCPLCAAASDHPRDAAERYCGRCGFVADAILRRASDRGWHPDVPPLGIVLAGEDGRAVSAGFSTGGFPGAPWRIGLEAQIWRVLLLPAQLRRVSDLFFAHAEAAGAAEPLLPGGRGAPHGWGRDPPDALREDCEGGPLAASVARSRDGAPLLALKPRHWGGCRLGLDAVRLLDDWAVVVAEARGGGGGGGPRLRAVG